MEKVDALAQLKDIHLPSPIGWWPLAPGWWVLILLVCMGVAGLVWLAFRQYLGGRAKRQALRLLADYWREYEKNKDNQLAAARVAELLRRVALVYYPRRQVARLTGESWLLFLNQSAKDLDFHAVSQLLLEQPYQKKNLGSLKPLFTRTQSWIKQRRRPCSN